MARLNVYVPDELAAAMRSELPGLNVSGVLRSSIEALLSCPHSQWRCLDCGADLDRAAVVLAEFQALWFAVIDEVEPLVFSQATAQGACDAMQNVFSARGVFVGPRKRPCRTERERNEWNKQLAKRETA